MQDLARISRRVEAKCVRGPSVQGARHKASRRNEVMAGLAVRGKVVQERKMGTATNSPPIMALETTLLT